MPEYLLRHYNADPDDSRFEIAELQSKVNLVVSITPHGSKYDLYISADMPHPTDFEYNSEDNSCFRLKQRFDRFDDMEEFFSKQIHLLHTCL